jgi:hypothetical protein
MKNSTADELRSYWKEQLTEGERRTLGNLRQTSERHTQTAAWPDSLRRVSRLANAADGYCPSCPWGNVGAAVVAI